MLSPLPVIYRFVPIQERKWLERATLHSMLAWFLILANVLQWLKVGSAVTFFLLSSGIMIGIVSGEAFSAVKGVFVNVTPLESMQVEPLVRQLVLVCAFV